MKESKERGMIWRKMEEVAASIAAPAFRHVTEPDGGAREKLEMEEGGRNSRGDGYYAR